MGLNGRLPKKYDYIIEMDADFSHNPKDLIRRLYNACEKERVLMFLLALDMLTRSEC